MLNPAFQSNLCSLDLLSSVAVKAGFLVHCALTFFLRLCPLKHSHSITMHLLSFLITVRFNLFCSVDASPKIWPLHKLIFTVLSLNNAMVHVLSSGSNHKVGSLARSVHFILKTQVKANLRQHPAPCLIKILPFSYHLPFHRMQKCFSLLILLNISLDSLHDLYCLYLH